MCRVLALIVLVFALMLVLPTTAGAFPRSGVTRAICTTFKSHCGEALRVAFCESRFNVWARNGQYVNVFQMGLRERHRYGWHVAGSSPWVAARAAYRYFISTGKDWSPWQCKPY